MPCFYPLEGWKARGGGWTANRRDAFIDLPMNVACGRCIGCKLERSRQWAVRCLHEAQLHEENCFLTLTLRDEGDGSVHVEDFQAFMKRLRKRIKRRVSYLHCGEYGENLGRPHYHAALFGYNFPDRRRWKGDLMVSEMLDEIWGLGYCTIGELTFESAAYIARYCTKKITGPKAAHHYTRVLETGEIVSIVPEYITMSRRPGIGKRWLERYHTDVYPSDEVIVRGKQARPPRYYDKEHAKLDELVHRRVQLARIAEAATPERKAERTPERLKVRKTVLEAQMSVHSKRKLENDA